MRTDRSAARLHVRCFYVNVISRFVVHASFQNFVEYGFAPFIFRDSVKSITNVEENVFFPDGVPCKHKRGESFCGEYAFFAREFLSA